MRLATLNRNTKDTETMGPFTLAWLVGEGIMVYRTYKKYHAPPGPGQLIWSSGLFVLLAFVATSEKARPVATIAAWGFDIAAFMNLYPPLTGPRAGPSAQPRKSETPGSTPPPGSTPGPWPPTAMIPDNVLLPGDTTTGAVT